MNGGTMGPGARGIEDRTKSLHQGSGWQSAAAQFLNVKVTRTCNCKKNLCAKYKDFKVVPEIF